MSCRSKAENNALLQLLNRLGKQMQKRCRYVKCLKCESWCEKLIKVLACDFCSRYPRANCKKQICCMVLSKWLFYANPFI